MCAASPERCLASQEPTCGAGEPASGPHASGTAGASCTAHDETNCRAPSSRRSRRERAQRPRRLAEAEARRKAVRFARQLAAQGVSCPHAAAHLQMVPRTLRSWRQDLQPTGTWEAKPRGRPLFEVDVATRNQVFRFLHHVTGPAVGLPALQDLFRTVPRCILANLSSRYRRVWQRRYARHGFELTWHHAGTVWAIDFTQPLEPIDGVFPYLLAIRDLASHCQLAWRPVCGETAEDVLPVLRELFAEHGPPLVLKSDNGSAFIAAVVHNALAEAAVAQLFSPVRRPQYNGALERSNGVLKTYTHQHAISAGHPFRWTSDDVDHARQLANTISRPWVAGGLSPEQAFQLRVPITERDRETFLAMLDHQRQWATHEMALHQAGELSSEDRARRDRLAISTALQDLGYLTLDRVRHAQKPKRLSREQLARRAAKYRAESRASESPVAENSTPPPAPEPAPSDVAHSSPGLLAAASPSDILQAASRASTAPQEPVREFASAHGEGTITSWLRRAFTPLLRLCKTAKISQ